MMWWLILTSLITQPGAVARAGEGERTAVTPHAALAAVPDTVRGSVFDSLAQQPLAGATVVASPGGEVVMTDSAGRFVLASRSRIERLAAYHDALTELRISALEAVRPQAAEQWQSAAMSIPSHETLWSRLCDGPMPSGITNGIVIGTTRASNDSMWLADVKVTVQWESIEAAKNRKQLFDQVEVQSDSQGYFVVCGTQSFGRAAVVAQAPQWHSAPVILNTSPHPVRRADIVLGSYSSGAPRLHAVRGRVVDTAGNGVADATVEVSGAGAVRTREDGSFTAYNVAPGSTTLIVRKVGFLASARQLDVMETAPPELHIVMARGTTLEDIRVTERVGLTRNHHDLLVRIQNRTAKFLDSIALTKFRTTANAMLSVPGINITRASRLPGDSEFIVRGFRGCAASIYVDGVRDENNAVGTIQRMPPEWIAVIEVYPAGQFAPSQFAIPGNCAMVFVWTKLWLREQERLRREQMLRAQRR